MNGKFDSRHPLAGLSDELIRLNGRLKTVFGAPRREAGLGDSELGVLNAVVEADRPPTVPQIGRSFGHPRQLVQRAVNSLIAAELVEAIPNPDHKRAKLLRATERGTALKREIDAEADARADALAREIDPESVRAATRALNAIRKQLEKQLRDLNEERD